MFDVLKKTKTCELFSPVIGRMIPIEEVGDKIFSDKIMGDGVAFIFDGDTLYSPCDGKVTMVASAGHAVGIRTKNHIEILLHVGRGAFHLNGKGFKILTTLGSKVKAHEPIIKLDRKLLKECDIDMTTPLIVTDIKRFQLKKTQAGNVDTNTVVMKLVKKRR